MMKVCITHCLLCFWIVLSNCSYTHAQTLPANRNLVSNGSFEFATCGTTFYNDSTFSNNPSCWISANKSRSAFLCPSVFNGYNAWARSGHSAFILFRTSSRLNLSTGNWIDTPDVARTYAETKFLAPLTIGRKYYLKFYFGTKLDTAAPTTVYLHDQDIVSNVGAYFSNNILRDNVHGGQIKVVPQINFTSHVLPYVDSFMYIELNGTYIAQGGEQYLTIGNFDDLENLVFMHITKAAQIRGLTSSYMNSVFIDDISLVADTTQPIISPDHFELGNDTVLCVGSSMHLGGDPYFFHYWWSTGDTTPSIIINTPGTYWCTVDYGCSTYTDTIHVYPPIAAVRYADTVSLCNSQLPYTYRPGFLPAPTMPVYYHWSNGSTGDSLVITQAGTYQLLRSDACGYARDSVQVLFKVQKTPTAYLPDTTVCGGQSLTLFAGAGYDKYMWSTGDSTTSIVVSQAGKYQVLAYNNCDTLRGTSTVTVEHAPSAFSLGNDTAICSGSSMVLIAPQGYTYTWYPIPSDQASIRINAPGTYVCVISNICGKSEDSITIKEIALPELGAGIFGDSTLCLEGMLVTGTLYNRSAFNKIWNTGGTADEIKVHLPGLYSLITSNTCGSHKEEIYVHGCQGIIAFPNAFSPNGDGLNDVFRPIVQDVSLVDEYVMKIYNRWGQQVFISFKPDFGWNGGQTDIGSFFYVCKYKEKNGKEEFVKGTLELLR